MDKIKILTTFFKDKILNLKDKLMNFPSYVKKSYQDYDKKKELHKAVGAWFIVFVVIIIVCRVNTNDIDANANETTIVIESESCSETTSIDRVSEKEIQKVALENTETESVTEQTTEPSTIIINENTTNFEQETIDVARLDVSTTPIADDVVLQDNFSSINAADVKTISSTKYDKNRLSFGIDVSYHNGNINWAKVKAAGVDYAFIRVGNRGYETGKLCIDSKYKEYIRGAKANGVKVGVYFFSQATTEAEALEEASLTLDLIKGYKLDLPVVFDWETSAGYRTYSGISRKKLTNIISVYMDTVEKYGYEAMLYMCKDDYINRIDTTTITSKYKTWVAWYFKEYSSNNYKSNFFKYGDLMPDMTFDYNVWQYSSKGRVDGIERLTDLNVMILPPPVYDITLNIPKDTFVINIGESISLTDGVRATDSSAKDVSNQVSVSIKNEKGKNINKEQAFNRSGKYSINYYYKDKNGQEITKVAVLYVRNKPEIYFNNVIWQENEQKELEYAYDEGLSADENYIQIQKLLKETIKSKTYDTINSVTSGTLLEGRYSGLESILDKNNINSGTYKITYTANDNKGLVSERKLLMVINKKEAVTEENPSEPNSESTEETSNDLGDISNIGNTTELE